MSNYNESVRSNYFKVKDIEKFKEWCKKRLLTFIESENLVGFCCEDGFPCYDDEDDKEVDVIVELADHLDDDHVGIVMGIGEESCWRSSKMLYLCGWATAINNKREIVQIDLHQIYDKAKELGEHITPAEY